MDKQKAKTEVYLISVNELGQKVYTAESDPSQSFIIDDDGKFTKYQARPVTMSNTRPNVQNIVEECNSDVETHDNEIVGNFDDTSDTIGELGVVPDFEDSFMQEIDPELMCVDADPEANCIMQHMDIREPLSTLKKLLEHRLGVQLPGYHFCLQGKTVLENHKNLVDQCVQGEGIVQINIQVQTHLKRINIIDVLKAAEDYDFDEDSTSPVPDKDATQEEEVKEKRQNIVQWQVDSVFKKEQERLKIPADPQEWDILHVRHWIQWAVRQFNLPNIKLSDWSMSGADLFKLTLTDFHKIVPNDPGDIFWTHLELLRKMKVVAIMKPEKTVCMVKKQPKIMPQTKINRIVTNYNQTANYYDSNSGNRSGNNGQIQLWQFLLELLTTKEYENIIQWIGASGEFRLRKPEVVARLWGERKNKPTMNYEKLSRALRYYYDGDMISKVHGHRFVYRFVCDLKQLLGYSAYELNRLVAVGDPCRKLTQENGEAELLEEALKNEEKR